MKSHDLAEGLKALATVLKRGPNIEVRELDYLVGRREGTGSVSPQASLKDDLPLALSALLSLSKIDKREWATLIADLGLNVSIGPRDSSRDVVGKVLRHLEKEPEARRALARKVNSKEAKASPELVRALSSLLGGS